MGAIADFFLKTRLAKKLAWGAKEAESLVQQNIDKINILYVQTVLRFVPLITLIAPAKGLPTVVGKIWILLDMAVFLKKSIFLIIRLLGGFGMVQNTPTGCGNNLPVLLRSNIFC